ncbi:MAG: histidine kinase [Burkholderiales bacterium]|nr:histidine kinase [Burkholderiales bacterium]
MQALPLRRWLPPYLLLFAGIALLLSLSELQGYLRRGGTRPWEPFLWEFSSLTLLALLGMPMYRLHCALRNRPWLQQLAAHLFGLLLFWLVHTGGMFAIRFGVYALASVPYEPGPWRSVLLYEAGKDAVSYLTIQLLCVGLLAWRRDQHRAEELDRTRRELAEAQAARLADQVQPHFLFNTLNLIAATVHEDARKADALICDLASLLRQTSNAQQRAEHSLAEELALAKPFLALMQARFGDRLRVSMDIAADAERVRVPALLLLAPLENAIKHDVALHRGAVTLHLSAHLRDGRLRIELHNSGFAPASVEGGEGGLGLRNLRLRLQARYGQAAQAELKAQTGGTCLRLELPA